MRWFRAGIRVLLLVVFGLRAFAQSSDTSRVVEEFATGPELPATWVAGPEYTIVSGELLNTETDDGWNYLAVFKGLSDVQEIAVVWGDYVFRNNSGSGAAAVAFALSTASTSANGYAVRKREEGLQLYLIEAGNLGSLVDEVPAPNVTTLPGGHDTTRVVLRNEPDGYYFDVYVNGQYDGTLVDRAKLRPLTSPFYSGVILQALSNGVNNVEAMTFTRYQDADGPEAIQDLAALPETPFSVRLQWTAPRDLGGAERLAVGYDIRYSTSPIDASNFSQAKPAPGAEAVVPAEPGTAEEFVVYGLAPNTLYYFAIRSVDGKGFWSDVSNVPSSSTGPLADRQTLFDGFEEGDLSPLWQVPSDFAAVSGELRNGGTAAGLAVWTGESDPKRVGIRWGSQADPAGVTSGGIALMLDSPTATPSGYFVTHQGDSLRLFPIANGVPTTNALATSPALSGTAPGPGDLMEVEILDDADGTHFLVFVNGLIDGVLHETEGARPSASHYFAGAVLAPGPAGAIDEFFVQVPVSMPASVEIVGGNNQTSQVMSLLPTPLTVRVRDASGAPVSGVMVDFRLAEGSAFLSVDSLAIEGHYFLEAESGKLRGAVQLQVDAAASDSAAVVNQSSTHGYVEFPLYISVPDTYLLWLRYQAPDETANSLCGFQVDGGDTLRNGVADWDFPVSPNYSWVQVPSLELPLSRGVHNLRILFHDVGFRLDKVLLSRDEAYTPQGAGEPAAVATNLTGADGSAWTRVRLGPTTGSVRIVAAVSGVDSVVFQAQAIPGPPDTMYAVGGNAQSGSAGQALPESLAVKVTDEYGNPLAGVEVQFAVAVGNGSVSPSTALTRTDGVARCQWTLGNDTTQQVVRATSPSLPDQVVEFHAQVGQGIPTSLVEAGGNGQQGKVGEPLPDSLKVRVLDNAGLPVAGHLVNFWVRSGLGTLNRTGTSVDVTTNSDGYAAVEFTLPTAARTVQVYAQAVWQGQPLQGSPVTFTLTALPGDPYRLVRYSGNDQTGPVGSTLPEPFVVQVEDQYGNPCPNHTVHFAVIEGNGSFAGQAAVDVVTDENGRASVVYTLGTEPGVTNRVEASSEFGGQPLIGSPVIFTATPLTGEATNLVYVSGDSQSAVVGTRLPEPLAVRVTDAFGNPIQGWPVDFEVKSGGGQLDSTRAWTGADGIARTGLTLGVQAGEGNQVVWATASRDGTPLNGSPVIFRASALPAAPHRLSAVGGSGQVGQAGTTLPQPFEAKVTDQYGNPVPGHPVLFVVVQGGGSIEGETSKEVLTGADGIARVFLTLGPTPGQANNRVQARSSYNGQELDGSPVTFVASAVPGEPSRLVEVSGNGQTGKAGSDLLEPFVVKVTDAAGNPIEGYLIHIRVVEGGGNIGGVSELDIATGTDGTVRATLTLGPTAGDSNNVVEFSAPNLEGSPIRFVASATPADPYEIAKVSGDGQTGPAGLPLPEPFVVRITDRFGNPIAGHLVTFRVLAGDGAFGGNGEIQVATNDSGLASATLTLGPRPGDRNNVAEASASYLGSPLQGSPVRFVASAVTGPPAILTYVSGDSQVGIVNSPLVYPFKVRVTDVAGNPVEGHPVEFRVVEGGGSFDGTDQTVVTRQTNRDGLCQVRLTLGPHPGADNNVVEAHASYEGNPLQGSPVVFHASARSSNARQLVYVSGNGQTGTVGKPLPQPLRVRVLDEYGNPVSGHPVSFRVLEGGGRLDGTDDTLIVRQSDADGYAMCVFTLGPKAGTNNNRVEASASNGIGPLQGSPILFTASAIADVTDPDSSLVWAEPDTAPADGTTPISLYVRLVDRYGNPIPGKAVVFSVSGEGNTIQQPDRLTDAQGVAVGSVRSTQAGAKTVRARNVTDGIPLSRSASVVFTPLAAERIVLASGNNQTRNVGTVLAESLAVRVEDRHGNPVADYPVEFVVTRGTGRILEPQPVKSNRSGIASVHYVLSTRPGTDFVEARAQGLEGSPVLFRLNAIESQPATIELVGGDGQIGVVGQWLPELLAVRVSDEDGDPVWGVTVRYETPTGGEAYPAVDSTDAWGVARAHFRLGETAGSYRVLAAVDGLGSAVEFTLSAQPDAPARLAVVSGNNQTGTVGLTLPQPLVVRVEDRFGNGVPQVPVSFEVLSGGGMLSGSMPVSSDAQGRASVAWTLGTRAGEQLVQAASDELEGSPVLFRATARPSTPDSIAVFSGNNQRGQVGKPLSLPIEAIVLDRYGNGVPGVAVTFATVDGMSEIVEKEPVNTDERGVAAAHWILGPQPGENVAWAIRLGVKGSPVVFRAIGEANEYPVITAPSDTSVMEEETLEFIVSAVDPDGGAVQIGASGLPEGAEFDSTGTGLFRWTPDLQSAGTYVLQFHARDDEGGVSYKVTTIRVRNKNRPPTITGYVPADTLLAATYPDTLQFRVTASDEDGDSLAYRWYVRRSEARRLVALDPDYLFVSTRHDPGLVIVEVLVTDREDTAMVRWQVTVRTAVELESFQAVSVPFEGVRLRWRTTREIATVGFNILRSDRPDGEYEQVNDQLVPPRRDRTYEFVDREVEAGKTYYYRLEDVNVSGKRTQHDPVAIRVALPERFTLHPNFPNPFNPVTHLRFELPRSGRVRIEIFNVLGKRIRTLVDANFEAGYHEVAWDGTDETGSQVASGVYFCRARFENRSVLRRMLLLR